MDKSFFLKGNILWSESPDLIKTIENGFLLCLEGKSGGVFKEIPAQYCHLPVENFEGKLIMPALADLHIHAPQFAFRALGMDMELLEWLNTRAFPEEAKYSDPEYAKEAYGYFVDHLKKGASSRFCIYATIHTEGTLLLMDMLEESGLVSFVGKVSMDANCPDYLKEGSAAKAEAAVREWLTLYKKGREEGRYKNTAPIITPRFAPSCSPELLNRLGEIQKEHNLPVQSHLSENRREVEWVKELFPESGTYAAVYDRYGLLGKSAPTIMAHCVWLDKKEEDLLLKNGVYIAHCPQSNTNLSSGIAPVRQLMDRGIPMGLGSDIAGGVHTSIFRAMSDAIGVSKLRRAITATEEKALTLERAFYLGTMGGGSFFGKHRLPESEGRGSPSGVGFGPSGSFKEGWDFDALVIDDSAILPPVKLSIHERLERVIYLSDDNCIIKKYIRGIPIK